MSASTRLPFDSRAPSLRDESLAVLIRGHEIAPGTQPTTVVTASSSTSAELVGESAHLVLATSSASRTRRRGPLTMTSELEGPARPSRGAPAPERVRPLIIQTSHHHPDLSPSRSADQESRESVEGLD
jgi:hypothetical protein